MMLNMALVFCAILLIFIKSENGGRLSWFYIIGIISTLTYLATNRKEISFYSISLMLMTTLLFLRVLTSWGRGNIISI
jgi:predicted membrane-bound dolichyl-phosphate-mannose-protein mannosyltransferase